MYTKGILKDNKMHITWKGHITIFIARKDINKISTLTGMRVAFERKS